ncbi:hypothetical protein [Spiroplasma endosymbiont of Polydrusus formosus]
MIDLEVHYIQLEVDPLLEKEKNERIETDNKLDKKLIIYQTKQKKI